MFLKGVGFLLISIIPIIVSIAFFTLLERKVIASVQRRKGPNIVGVWGLLQPVADGLKLLTQEQFFPKNSRKIVFLLSPCLVFAFSLSFWAFIPTANGSLSTSDLTVLVVWVISSISVFGVFLAGISGASKYSILGSLRAVSQFISYEVCSGVVLLFIAFIGESLCLLDVVFVQSFCGFFLFMGWPFALSYFICILAETNRTPFDLSEAEAELVAGFHTEFSSTGFALFFLGEYCNILVFSIMFCLLFLGGWNPDPVVGKSLLVRSTKMWGCYGFVSLVFFNLILFSKVVLLCVVIIIIRAGQPRLRFDQVMELG